MEYDFAEPPAVGAIHEKHGNRYELVAVESYTRKSDGGRSALLTWLGTCAACGVAFTVKAGLNTKALNRRCSECAQPLKPATKAAKAASREGGRKAGRRMRALAKLRRELLS